MNIVRYDQLIEIISYIPKTHTRCSSTKDFIEAYLDRTRSVCLGVYRSQNLEHDIIIKFPFIYDTRTHRITHEYRKKYICLNTIKKIDNILNKYGYISVGLEVYSSNIKLDHEFIVCLTDKGQVICDSYLNTRPVEIRPFNLYQTLISLIKTPTIHNWNHIWKSLCTGKIDDVYRLKSIEVSYYDINRNETNYINNVRIKN